MGVAAATSSGSQTTYTETNMVVYCLESFDQVSHTHGSWNRFDQSTTPRQAGSCASSATYGWSRVGGLILQGAIFPNPVQWCLVGGSGSWIAGTSGTGYQFGGATGGPGMPCGDKYYSLVSNHDGLTYGGYERVNQASPWLWLHQNYI